jgi:hypothetical protein
MSLPYQDATTGAKAMDEVQRILQRFGVQNFGHMQDFEKGELIVQFTFRNIPICVRASAKGYAAAWLKENPYSHRRRASRAEWEQRALDIGGKAVYSILRDWIKGQVMAIESGILSFEGAFLGQMLLPTGETVLDRAINSKMLPQLSDQRPAA